MALLMVLINFNAIFPVKICCNFSYKNLSKNVGIMHASRLSTVRTKLISTKFLLEKYMSEINTKETKPNEAILNQLVL